MVTYTFADKRDHDEHLELNEDSDDEMDIEDVDKISPLLCNVVDGTLSSLREVLVENLKHDDLMLIWHMSVPSLGGNHSLQVLAAWWDDISSAGDATTKTASGKKWYKKSKENTGKKSNLVMESAKLEADSSRINYLLQSLLDALNARSSNLRLSMSVDAIRALSECFALGEVLQMAPQYVSNIVICCPPMLRLVPWHALTVNLPSYMVKTTTLEEPPQVIQVSKEDNSLSFKGDSKPSELSPLKPIIESHDEGESYDGEEGLKKPETPDKAPEGSNNIKINDSGSISAEEIRVRNKNNYNGENKSIAVIEKYAVLLGPTLSMYEMNCNKQRKVDHSAGNHKMCFIDGDSNVSAARGSHQECEAMTKTWSGDPWDYVVLSGLDASVSNLTTKVDRLKREEHDRKVMEANPPERPSFMRRTLKPARFEKKGRSAMISTKNGNKNKEGDVLGGLLYAFGDFMDGKRVRNKNQYMHEDESSESSEGESESSGDLEAESKKIKEREYCDHSLTFLTCRVLHICASKVVCATPSSVVTNTRGSNTSTENSKINAVRRQRAYPSLVFPIGTEDSRTMLTARYIFGVNRFLTIMFCHFVSQGFYITALLAKL